MSFSKQNVTVSCLSQFLKHFQPISPNASWSFAEFLKWSLFLSSALRALLFRGVTAGGTAHRQSCSLVKKKNNNNCCKLSPSPAPQSFSPKLKCDVRSTFLASLRLLLCPQWQYSLRAAALIYESRYIPLERMRAWGRRAGLWSCYAFEIWL